MNHVECIILITFASTVGDANNTNKKVIFTNCTA